jgi:hypothetical protein
MKIKFENAVELEITDFKSCMTMRVFKAGEELRVDSVECNEAFETATIIINEWQIIYGVPLNVFKVITVR